MKSAARLVPCLLLLLCSVCDAAPASGATAAGPQPTSYTNNASFAKAVDRLPPPDHPVRPGRQHPPQYPDKWKAWGKPAYAIVVLLVDEYGNFEDAQCTEATDRAFARAAEKGVSDWTFIPALKNQQAVRSKITLRFDFENPTTVKAALVPPPAPGR